MTNQLERARNKALEAQKRVDELQELINRVESCPELWEVLNKNEDHVLHTGKLYGVDGSITFSRPTPDLILQLLPIIKERLIETRSARGYSYIYENFPNTERSRAIVEGKSQGKLTYTGGDQCFVKTGQRDFSIGFYLDIDGSPLEVELCFLSWIVSKNYSTIDRGYRVPHYVDNPKYSPTGKGQHECKYRVCDASRVQGLFLHAESDKDLGYNNLTSLAKAIHCVDWGEESQTFIDAADVQKKDLKLLGY